MKQKKGGTEAVPHQEQLAATEKMLRHPGRTVFLERARGPVGAAKLAVPAELWKKIRDVAGPRYTLEDDRRVLAVDEGARFVTCLRENSWKTTNWSENEHAVFLKVQELLFKHDGIVITYA